MNVLAEIPLVAADEDWGGPWWPLWLLFWAALVATAVWLLVRRRGGGDPLARAREVLAERYARGEIDGEEYRERAAELARDRRGS